MFNYTIVGVGETEINKVFECLHLDCDLKKYNLEDQHQAVSEVYFYTVSQRIWGYFYRLCSNDSKIVQLDLLGVEMVFFSFISSVSLSYSQRIWGYFYRLSAPMKVKLFNLICWE